MVRLEDAGSTKAVQVGRARARKLEGFGQTPGIVDGDAVALKTAREDGGGVDDRAILSTAPVIDRDEIAAQKPALLRIAPGVDANVVLAHAVRRSLMVFSGSRARLKSLALKGEINL